jgi:cardiolipin synthase
LGEPDDPATLTALNYRRQSLHRYASSTATKTEIDDRQTRRILRELADRALTRAAEEPLVRKNHVRLLKDARQNYPAWLEAIKAARHHVHFESYFICEDDSGREFAEALIAKAREGVRVRLIYDWLGGFARASRHFWNRLRAGTVDVRCYNPPSFDSPFGWLSRDHRKMLAVDGQAGFVSGLCVGAMWAGEPERNIEPWRDTGVEVRGPAVAEIERAFAEIWRTMGEPIPEVESIAADSADPAGNMDVRIIASLPATAGMIRVDELIAALARRKLWLTDAYFAGTTSYVQALRAAAKDGADVRLLVPNATDVPLLRPLSRAGYRPLLEAGVRIFEWNGTMIHAKSAVADDHWARVGSTNLNIASWFGNCELDVFVEDDSFAREMQEMYLEDLTNATEIVLARTRKVLTSGEPRHPGLAMARGRGSAGRAAAGAIRVGNAIGAAFTNRRVLGPVEARIMFRTGLCLFALAIVLASLPRLLCYPLAALLTWMALTLIFRGWKLSRRGKIGEDAMTEEATSRARLTGDSRHPE